MRTDFFVPRILASAIFAQLLLRHTTMIIATRCDVGEHVLVVISEADMSSLKGWKDDCPRRALHWCLLHGIVLALVGMESFEVGWLHNSSTADFSSRDVVARRDARGLDTTSCLQVLPSSVHQRWSRDFVSDFLTDPHPLCLPDPGSTQRSTFTQQGFVDSELLDAISQVDWDHWLIGGGWRQPSGLRNLYPGAPAFDLRMSGNPIGTSWSKKDVAGRVVGATYNLKAPILQEGDVWLYRDHEMSMSFGASDVSLFSGMVDTMEGLSFIDVAHPFSASGILTSWRWVGCMERPMYFKVYRPIDTFVFKLIAVFTPPSTIVGLVNHFELAGGDQITVQRGDVIGWTFIGLPSIGFRQENFGNVVFCPFGLVGQHAIGTESICSEESPRVYDIMAVSITDSAQTNFAGDRRLIQSSTRTSSAGSLQHDDWHNFSVVDTAHPFIEDGFITGWKWVGCAASPVVLQIYRPAGAATYVLVGETYVKETFVGTINQVHLNIADQIAVSKGDVFGWTFLGAAAFGYFPSDNGRVRLCRHRAGISERIQIDDSLTCSYELSRVYDVAASFAQVRVHGMPPSIIKGRSFLEMAAVDGRNCFHAERLGATDVLCVDYHLWGGREDKETEIGSHWPFATFAESFKLEHCLRQSHVRAMRVNVYDLSPSLVGGLFDIVRAFGLAYHLKHPVLGIEALSSITREALIIETEVLGIDVPVPENYPRRDLALCQWFRDGELSNDTTNFWACNSATWLNWLTSFGFATIAEISRTAGAGPSTVRSTFVATKPGASVSVRNFLGHQPED